MFCELKHVDVCSFKLAFFLTSGSLFGSEYDRFSSASTGRSANMALPTWGVSLGVPSVEIRQKGPETNKCVIFTRGAQLDVFKRLRFHSNSHMAIRFGDTCWRHMCLQVAASTSISPGFLYFGSNMIISWVTCLRFWGQTCWQPLCLEALCITCCAVVCSARCYSILYDTMPNSSV